MKKIHYLSIALCLVLFACNKSDGDTEPVPGDFSGTWSGSMGCSVENVSVSFAVLLNIQADNTRCADCYAIGLSTGGSPEDTVLATEVDGQLVFDRTTIDLGGMDGMVSIDGTCQMTGAGQMEFALEMNQISGGNFGYTCTSMLSKQ